MKWILKAGLCICSLLIIDRALRLDENPEYQMIRVKGLEETSPSDVVIETSLTTSYSEPIIRVENEKFVSNYQGRLYPGSRPVYEAGALDYSALHEYFAEGFLTYIEEPEKLLSRDPSLYHFIGGLLDG